MPTRLAEKAGTWYPASPMLLGELIDNCLNDAEEIPCDGIPIAAIVPHAGLSFSGPCAAKAFSVLMKVEPETVIMLGAVHTMRLEKAAVWTCGTWETPLGEIRVDAELASELIKNDLCEDNALPHYGDNAIELQTPFIRHCFPNSKILPVAVPPIAGIEKVGDAVKEAVEKLGRKAVVLGSTDLTHYGDSFGWTPAGYGAEALKWAEDRDRELIDLAIGLKSSEIVNNAQKNHSACGAGAMAATVAYASQQGSKGYLLEQTNSHKILPDGEARHFVGYASIVFCK